jgi:ActR/RegA family two-component response regulator
MGARDHSQGPVRVLFVDDEPSIRLTLPAILKRRGYDVAVAATVPEALAEIAKDKFDVLLTDLNIGHPADGFTVVSAMRRTQPDCVNLILTGYPAFETALEAIRSHVDDYLTKPADVEHLVKVIEEKLQNPQPRHPVATRRFTGILRDNIELILNRVLVEMKSRVEQPSLPISDEQRINYYRQILNYVAESLELGTHKPNPAILRAAAQHGKERKQQGYAAPLLVEDVRCLCTAINTTIEENLLALDFSELLPDLKQIYDMLQLQLKESISSFLSAGPAEARGKVRKRTSKTA